MISSGDSGPSWPTQHQLKYFTLPTSVTIPHAVSHSARPYQRVPLLGNLQFGPTNFAAYWYGWQQSLYAMLLHPIQSSSLQLLQQPSLPLLCIICAKIFLNPIDLYLHLQSHSYVFSAGNAIVKNDTFNVFHIPTKSTKKSTKNRDREQNSVTSRASASSICRICGKTFSRNWLLEGHIRTHTGEKPFQCRICSKAFADKSNLRAHIQTHSGTKPHVCSVCGKRFALKSYLTKHEESTCKRQNETLSS